MLEIITLIVLSAILGSLVGIAALIRHIKNNYSLYRRQSNFIYPDRKSYNLIINQLDVISSNVQCKLCNSTIRTTNKHPVARCECGEVFVDGAHCHLIIGAKSLDNVEDNTTISTRTIVIDKDVEQTNNNKRGAHYGNTLSVKN